jgi:hypothetical protein
VVANPSKVALTRAIGATPIRLFNVILPNVTFLNNSFGSVIVKAPFFSKKP